MRTVFGMIIGCLLTIAALYIHDSMATSTVASGATPDTSRVIVNWDVAAREWGLVKENVQTVWQKFKLTTAENRTHPQKRASTSISI